MHPSPHRSWAQGSVLIYAVILAAIFGMLGLIVAYKAEMLTNNLDSQETIAALGFNIEEKANNAREYDMALNRNGSGYTAIQECPQYSVSWSTRLFTGSSMNMTQSAKLQRLYCEATLTGSTKLAVYYRDDGKYSHAQILDWSIPPSPVSITGKSYPISLGNSYSLNALTGNTSINRDFDCNNDDHSAYISGTTLCFDSSSNSQTTMVATNSGQDDDQNAMLEIFGSTRIGGGYTSVFWNSPKTMTFIDTHIKNPALFESLSGATNGAIVHFVFSWTLNSTHYYRIMIVSYDEDEFVSTHRLVPIDSIIGSWTLIKEGYILNKNPLLLWSESSQAKAFPIHNSLFGIFVSYEWPEDSQNWSNNTLDFKMRMYSITSYSPLTMGKEVMIVPLSYSWWEYQFWGSDIQPMGRDHPYREYGINLME